MGKQYQRDIWKKLASVQDGKICLATRPKSSVLIALLSRAISLVCTGIVSAQEASLLWGDLHLHTNMSQDAFPSKQGVSPEMTYRFARGIPIYYPNLGSKITIGRPLDFLAVTDHAANLGLDVMIKNENTVLAQTQWA